MRSSEGHTRRASATALQIYYTQNGTNAFKSLHYREPTCRAIEQRPYFRQTPATVIAANDVKCSTAQDLPPRLHGKLVGDERHTRVPATAAKHIL